MSLILWSLSVHWFNTISCHLLSYSLQTVFGLKAIFYLFIIISPYTSTAEIRPPQRVPTWALFVHNFIYYLSWTNPFNFTSWKKIRERLCVFFKFYNLNKYNFCQRKITMQRDQGIPTRSTFHTRKVYRDGWNNFKIYYLSTSVEPPFSDMFKNIIQNTRPAFIWGMPLVLKYSCRFDLYVVTMWTIDYMKAYVVKMYAYVCNNRYFLYGTVAILFTNTS